MITISHFGFRPINGAHGLISVMYGTPNNSIHEFGMTKNVILARLHGGKRHLYFKKASCFRHFLTKSMLANYTISRKFQHNAALYLFIF